MTLLFYICKILLLLDLLFVLTEQTRFADSDTFKIHHYV